MGVIRSFQDCRLFPDLSVEDVLMVCEDAGRPVSVVGATLQLPWARRSERRKREAVDRVIGAFGLGRFRHHRAAEISTGTRRVVDLASIVLADPRLLLLDEPTAGIAQREAEAFVPLLRRLRDVADCTILLVEHDVPLVFALCSHVVVMEAGAVVAVGTPDEISRDPRALAAYLGASEEALTSSGRYRASGGNGASLRTQWGRSRTWLIDGGGRGPCRRARHAAAAECRRHRWAPWHRPRAGRRFGTVAAVAPHVGGRHGRGRGLGAYRPPRPAAVPPASAWPARPRHGSRLPARARRAPSTRGIVGNKINVVFPVVSLNSLAGKEGFAQDLEFGEQNKAIKFFASQVNQQGASTARRSTPSSSPSTRPTSRACARCARTGPRAARPRSR